MTGFSAPSGTGRGPFPFSCPDGRFLKRKTATCKRRPLIWRAVKSGKFGSDYEIYLSDQFPFRDSWIGFKTAAEKIQLKKEINGVFLGKDGYLIEAFYAEDMDPELSKKNLDALAAFALRQEALLGDGHVNVLLAPTASEILTEKLPASASPFSQAAATDFLEKAGLSSMLVPVRDALLQEEADGPDRPLYYRTDHHWTALRGLYGLPGLGFCFRPHVPGAFRFFCGNRFGGLSGHHPLQAQRSCKA